MVCVKDELGEAEIVSQRALRDGGTLGGKDHDGVLGGRARTVSHPF
jgi:hypothetical protein